MSARKPKADALALGAVEVTIFRLNGCTRAEFFEANWEVDDWLRRQPGFRSRRIAERDDGEIVDVLVWDSVEAGEDGASRLMRELAHSVVHSMIDQSSVSWSVLPVRRVATA
ncbi:MAG: hypothetical protein M3N82_02340 [Pseudomonadota bacterium]|nr:hypothetical protein [Pseudomonadota bacterium]